MDYFSGVAGQRSKETSVTVHDNETESSVVFEEFIECFCVEFVVAEVKGSIDWFEGFKINIEFALFSFISNDVPEIRYVGDRNLPAEYNKTIGRNPIVQF